MSSRPLQRYLPWGVVLATCAVLFAVTGVDTSADSAFYLSWSLNLADGLGYTHIDGSAVTNRGPILSFLFAIAFKLFGADVTSAFLVIRTFFVINVCLTFWLATRMFGAVAGLAAAALLLSGFYYHSHLTRLAIDGVVPAFLLAAMLLCYRPGAYVRSASLLTGVVLAVGYLTKEIFIVFFALPWVWLALTRIAGLPQQPFSLKFFALGVGAVLAPWLVWVVSHGGSAVELLGWNGIKIIEWVNGRGAVGDVNTLPLSSRLSEWAERYLERQIKPTGVLWPALLVAPLAAWWCRSSAQMLLLAALVCWLPVALHIGRTDLRPGQSLPIIVVLLVCFTGVIASLVKRILANRAPHRIALASAVVAIVGVTSYLHTQKDTRRLLLGERVERTHGFALFADVSVTQSSPLDVRGFIPRIDKLASVLNTQLNDAGAVLTDSYTAAGLTFVTRHAVRSVDIQHAYIAATDADQAERGDQALFLYGGDWSPLRGNNALVALSRRRLVDIFNGTNVGLVVLRGRHQYIADALVASGAFETLTPPKRIAFMILKPVNRVDDESFARAAVATSPALGEQLMMMRRASPHRYNQLFDDFLNPIFGLSAAELTPLQRE